MSDERLHGLPVPKTPDEMRRMLRAEDGPPLEQPRREGFRSHVEVHFADGADPVAVARKLKENIDSFCGEQHNGQRAEVLTQSGPPLSPPLRGWLGTLWAWARGEL